MKNILCPSCKQELCICNSPRVEDWNEDNLIIILEKALCENCRKVFDVQFEVSNIVDIGDENDFYLFEDDEEHEFEDYDDGLRDKDIYEGTYEEEEK